MSKWIYTFGDGRAEGSADMRNLLGGKGANLAEMSKLNIPVPPGFTISTEVCGYYISNQKSFPDQFDQQLDQALTEIGQITGREFGNSENPQLVSVRSGARVSMPGMMDTVLNLGLNDESVLTLAKISGSPRFAYDSYRRFIQMYADVVMGLDFGAFEEILERFKSEKSFTLDTELETEDLQTIVNEFKSLYQEELQEQFPQDPKQQLWGAIESVMGSWSNPRAKTYRQLHNIPEDWGTAVNVQAMVFGNLGDDSASGVAFTRNPSTGENQLYGEFLINAQGEDVVAGTRTPQNITEAARIAADSDKPSLEQAMPRVFDDFVKICGTLESHYRDMQDVEFTIESSRLWMLQTRSGKRTAKAALKIAVEMVESGTITEKEALLRVEPGALDQLLHPTIDPGAERKIITTGLPASPGAATGSIVFTSEDAEQLAGSGEKVILVRVETSPEDIHGMHAAEGILTARGGMTSHAAVVARGMGKPCVSGAGGIRVDSNKEQLISTGKTFKKGDVITLDGATGQVLEGAVKMQQSELSGDFAKLMSWADNNRRLKIRTNAETPLDAKAARDFGAEGIGLCRTEHMFFEGERIIAMREMILAETEEGRKKALAKLLPMQKSDFKELFIIMQGLPVTIRLLDPPLHEFLPKSDKETDDVAGVLGVEPQRLKERSLALHEFNPMLGHRGCRLLVSYPEIVEMQARAIFEAAVEAGKETGASVVPEVMVPLVSLEKELSIVRKFIDSTAAKVAAETGINVDYQVGTMIELPRAALMSAEIANDAEFFSFGTNDLTQTAFGISRDDASLFLNRYLKDGLINRDPFVSIDRDGVGALIEISVERGRSARPEIKLGICGEHGGDSDSIKFCEEVGLDYVSCSPYRVPVARLAAAQSAILNQKD